MMSAVEDFAADYFVREGLTADRQYKIRRALRLLEAHAQVPAEQVDDLMLRSFVTAQVASGLHVNTVRQRLHAVTPFFKWAWQQRVIDAERWLRIKDVSPPRGSTNQPRPRPYARKEIMRFWDELDARWPLTTEKMIRRYERGTSRYPRVWRHAAHLQVQAVVSLALFGGLRRSEIRFAGIDDIHPDNDFIVVDYGKSPFGQGNGHREVPYTVQGRELVGRWLEFRARLKPTHDTPWLVLTATASPNNWMASHPLDPIKQDGFENLLPRIGAWELHRFRHTCATEWLRAGVPLERVSRLLGHTNITQTLGYAELMRDDVADSMRRAEQDFVTAVGRRQTQLVQREEGKK